MSGIRNIEISNENRKIICRNAYELNGTHIFLKHSFAEHRLAIVLTPQKIKAIENKTTPCTSGCAIQVVNAGSFAYPTDLVMNFANPVILAVDTCMVRLHRKSASVGKVLCMPPLAQKKRKKCIMPISKTAAYSIQIICCFLHMLRCSATLLWNCWTILIHWQS